MELPVLEPPYEILEMRAGEIVKLRVLKYGVGTIEIKPRYPRAPPRKIVKAIRIWVPKELKRTVPYYFDLTAGTLVAGVLPLLEKGLHKENLICIRKVGYPPKARFEVWLEPIPT